MVEHPDEARAGEELVSKKDNDRMMLPKIKALMDFSECLAPASPALAAYFKDQADFLQSRLGDFNMHGILVWESKVNALAEAATVLLDEWKAHQS